MEITESIKPQSICTVIINNYYMKVDMWNNSLFNEYAQTNLSSLFMSTQAVEQINSVVGTTTHTV